MNLILSGGGVKGIIYLGLLKILKEKKINIKKFGGTSIGVFFNLLILLEYKYEEIEEILLNNKIEKIFDVNLLNFFENYSICSNEMFKKILNVLIYRKLKKRNVTLKELYDLTKKEFHIITLNISTGEEIILNKDNNPKLEVITGILAACSIPGIFSPIKINNEMYIDGFIINNYPIDIFKNELENTIGINLNERHYYKDLNVKNYIHNLFTILKKLFESAKSP